ncbi:hypothetical protein BH11GEM2_BH11GEM2_30500 [soil metagenome]
MVRDVLPMRDAFTPHVDLPFTIDLPVLGIATRFETNSRDVHSLVVETFGAWAGLEGDDFTRLAPIAQVCIAVREGSEQTAGRSTIRHSFPDDLRVVAQSAGSLGISDPLRAQAIAHVTSELVADREHFRDEMLQALTLALLSSFDRHFLHAAAVACGNRAVLLAAPSGTGKSTLAYLAHRSGLQVMSEDRVWVQQSPLLRVWGWPLRLHLRPESAVHFPELDGAAIRSCGTGKQRHVVDLALRPGGARQFHADRVVVCLLTRGEGTASLERVEAGVVVESLCRDVAPGFDRQAVRHAPAMRAIAAGGGWRLRLSGNPHEALPLLRQMLDA